ncbi:MAG: D,D-dipeptide ABC transporter permease, partial [Dehalococcoidia bacterium]|nr:D,D-dipeptide ABC transporter permease [Dehalococcoidia bacterium]
MASLESTLAGDYFHAPIPSTPVRILRGTWQFTRRKPLGAFGALVLILIMVVGAFSPWIATHDPTDADLGAVLEGPSADHLFGTDFNGRDLFSRIVFGAQITGLVGLGTVFLVAFISLVVGVTSGYFGGKFDFGIQRLVDVWLSFPAIFLILTLVAVLQSGASS